MTEDEAKTKWCPKSMMIVVTDDDNRNVLNASSFNRCEIEGGKESYHPLGTNCIASDCAWWVWDTTKTRHYPDEPISKPSGHCGAIK